MAGDYVVDGTAAVLATDRFACPQHHKKIWNVKINQVDGVGSVGWSVKCHA